MRLKYTLLLACLVTTSCSVNRQKFKKKFNESMAIILKDSVLKSLHTKSSILIILNRISAHSMIKKDYKILSLQQKKWIAIQYFVRDAFTSNENRFDYNEAKLDNNIGDSIFQIFTKNKFWKIKDIDNGCKENEYRNTHNSCTSGGSASNFEIILIRKLKISTKNYFNPIFYETECCPGNKDRQIFIKCFNAVNSLFPPP